MQLPEFFEGTRAAVMMVASTDAEAAADTSTGKQDHRFS